MLVPVNMFCVTGTLVGVLVPVLDCVAVLVGVLVPVLDCVAVLVGVLVPVLDCVAVLVGVLEVVNIDGKVCVGTFTLVCFLVSVVVPNVKVSFPAVNMVGLRSVV